MSILDIFSFKKQFAKVFTRDNFNSVLSSIKDNIIEQSKEAISGLQKKSIVDVKVTYFIREKLVMLNITNKLVLWVVERIIDVIPTITQAIYDCLKSKIENL